MVAHVERDGMIDHAGVLVPQRHRIAVAAHRAIRRFPNFELLPRPPVRAERRFHLAALVPDVDPRADADDRHLGLLLVDAAETVGNGLQFFQVDPVFLFEGIRSLVFLVPARHADDLAAKLLFEAHAGLQGFAHFQHSSGDGPPSLERRLAALYPDPAARDRERPRYVERLEPWRGMLAMGLTTVPETPEPTRSDSHAWSAHPNYGLLATVLGVRPAEPGFRSVRIAPHHYPDAGRAVREMARVTRRGGRLALIDNIAPPDAALDAMIDAYENKIGPRNGARVVAKAWTDPAYKVRLMQDATAAIAELGYSGAQGEHMPPNQGSSQAM